VEIIDLAVHAPQHSVRVPLIFPFAGRIPASKRVQENVSLVDLFPTLCDYAGLPTPPNGRGQSLRPLIEGSPAATQRAVLSEFYYAQSQPPAVMSKRGQIKLVDYGGAFPPQLFDLERDPDEQTNLADDPACAGVRAELQAVIDDLPDPLCGTKPRSKAC
jgi:choline-sulfatase